MSTADNSSRSTATESHADVSVPEAVERMVRLVVQTAQQLEARAAGERSADVSVEEGLGWLPLFTIVQLQDMRARPGAEELMRWLQAILGDEGWPWLAASAGRLRVAREAMDRFGEALVQQAATASGGNLLEYSWAGVLAGVQGGEGTGSEQESDDAEPEQAVESVRSNLVRALGAMMWRARRLRELQAEGKPVLPEQIAAVDSQVGVLHAELALFDAQADGAELFAFEDEPPWERNTDPVAGARDFIASAKGGGR